MASYRTRSNGTVEAVIKRSGLLPRPVSMTFDSEVEARRVCERIEALLDQGIVPPELGKETREAVSTLGALIREYLKAVAVTPDDDSLLTLIAVEDGRMSLTKLNYDWAEAWINVMKRERNLAPSTIRKYVGALARCCDWGANKGIAGVLTHPLRRLPRGYSTYTAEDKRILADCDLKAKVDEERDRRLELAEEKRIEDVLAGWKPEGRQRGLKSEYREEKRDLFHLALDSCMRMREMLTLTVDQVDFKDQSVRLDRTKNGDKRVVPMMTDRMEAILRHRCKHATPDGRLFPWWSGVVDRQDLKAAVNKVSHQWTTVTDMAGCGDVTFHDLRHEAVSRLFEHTELNDTEIARITGHRDPRQLRRYTHLRPSAVVAKVRKMRGAD
jgi:integrase